MATTISLTSEVADRFAAGTSTPEDVAAVAEACRAAGHPLIERWHVAPAQLGGWAVVPPGKTGGGLWPQGDHAACQRIAEHLNGLEPANVDEFLTSWSDPEFRAAWTPPERARS
jgi:hypothetical protein